MNMVSIPDKAIVKKVLRSPWGMRTLTEKKKLTVYASDFSGFKTR
jgi:hypothetical protein